MKKYILTLVILNSFAVQAMPQKSLTQQLEEKAQGSKSMPENIKKEFKSALDKLRQSELMMNAKKENANIPSFNIKGKKIADILKKGPLVLKFYRGSWCPYCQIELKNYELYQEKIKAKGYQIIVLTPDTEKEIKKFKVKNKITMNIHQDKNNEIAKKFGVVFKIGDKLNEIYKGFGIDLDKSQGNDNQELPLPGTYVINTDGKITFSFLDIDYKKRLDPIELLKHLN